MRPERTDLKYVWDMLDAGSVVVQLTKGRSIDEFARDRAMRFAVERAIEIIGEAARHVSTGFQTAHSDVPWRAIIATRHIFAHEYDDLQHDKVWRIATTHIPALIGKLQPILDAHPPSASADRS